MKKRISMISLSAALCVTLAVLSGCGAQAPEPSGSEPTENVVVSTISLPGEVMESSQAPVETQTQVITSGDVTITFEQMTDAGTGAAVNRLLEEDRDRFIQSNLLDKEGNDLGLSGEMTATMIQHGDTLCVVTTGVLTDEKGSKELMAYTTNLSLETGSRTSTGVREQAAKAAAVIAAGKAVVMEADAGKQTEISAYLKQLGEKKLTSLLERCDFTDEDTAPKCFSYFLNADTDEIGIYVPVSDTLGHYAIVLVERDQLV